MVPPAGHDPATSRLKAGYSAHLSYGGMVPVEGFKPSPLRLRA